jgi:hypothetical protein
MNERQPEFGCCARYLALTRTCSYMTRVFSWSTLSSAYSGRYYTPALAPRPLAADHEPQSDDIRDWNISEDELKLSEWVRRLLPPKPFSWWDTPVSKYIQHTTRNSVHANPKLPLKMSCTEIFVKVILLPHPMNIDYHEYSRLQSSGCLSLSPFFPNEELSYQLTQDGLPEHVHM